MYDGLLNLPFWWLVVLTLVMTHVTCISITVFLHRHQAHRALDLHPAVSHFFRFWLWLTTGMVTKEWVAVHRKHHAKCETEEDPHSPQILGLNRVLWGGAFLYRKEAANTQTLADYGHATPNDWIERHLYTPYNARGITFLLFLDLLLFGVYGAGIWLVQMLWTPFWAAGVINGVGHYLGYRNFECKDHATNISPVGILVAGEELHNNHHAFPSSAKFSNKPWEFDIGWFYIQSLVRLGLARVKKVAARPYQDPKRSQVDMSTVQAVIVNRMHILADYARQVTLPVWQRETDKVAVLKDRKLRKLLVRERYLLDDISLKHLREALTYSPSLQTVYNFRERLQDIWDSNGASQEHLLERLKEWCLHAEQTGVTALQEFAACLRSYTMPTNKTSVR